MATYYKETETTTTIDAEGNETSNILEKTKIYDRVSEPDYIKLYIKPGTAMKPDGTSSIGIQGIPAAYRNLFIQLAMRMTYCNSNDIRSAQIVNTDVPFSYDIMRALNWGTSMYYKGLKELAARDIIRKVRRGVYRINPIYASRGEWRHNDKLNRGGVMDLVNEFKRTKNTDSDSKDIDLDIVYIWAHDGTDTPENKMWKEGLDIKEDFDEGSLKTVTRKHGPQ